MDPAATMSRRLTVTLTAIWTDPRTRDWVRTSPFGHYPERLAADSAYGSAEMLGWLVHEGGIEPHIPVFDKSERRDGTFERADFTYDHEANAYVSRPARSSGRGRRPIGCRGRSPTRTA